MKKFEVLLLVKEPAALRELLQHRQNINLSAVNDAEQAIEWMQNRGTDIIIFETGTDFPAANKLRTMQRILNPNAVIVDFNKWNFEQISQDLEMAMEQVNRNLSGGTSFHDAPEMR